MATRTRGRKGAGRSASRREPWLTLPRLRAAGLILLWAATLGGTAYGLHRLEPFALERLAAQDWTVAWQPQPPTVDEWILGEIEQTILAQAGDGAALNVLAPGFCARLGAAVADSPWVADVRRVSVSAGGVVTISAQVRQYLTFVVQDGYGYLVDEQGVRLPRTEPERYLDQYDMIVLEGIREPVPVVGEAWSGDAVQGGLKLVKLLMKKDFPGFVAVDASNYGNRIDPRSGWLQVRTAEPGGRILWGLPPGEEYDVESRADRKLEMLWSYYADHGRLPQRVTDVRDPAGLVFRAHP